MKTLIAICLLSCLAVAQTAGSAFIQTKAPTLAANLAPAVIVTYSITGSFTAPIAAFSLLGTCQPGPSPTFPACALPTASLGIPYVATLPTSGLNAPVTCTVASGTLPSWATLTVSGTSCVISGTPNNATPLNFSLTASGQ